MPDLLFEDDREKRVDAIRPLLEKPKRVDASMPIHRLTVFLTYRCNLDCPYCKTKFRKEAELVNWPSKACSIDLEAFSALLRTHEATPIEHIHFTGGEASLIADLPKMIRLARERGVVWISLTTNGTRSVNVYQELVDAGIDELRFSLDAASAALGSALTGDVSAWRKTVENIELLAKVRDKNGAPFLIVNTVVGLSNRSVIPEILGFLLKLGPPNDIKLITEVDQKRVLRAFPEQEQVRHRLKKVLAPYAEDAYPLLRRKIMTVFAPDAIGLNDVAAPAGKAWRCYVPLTERTLDGKSYYPCSVYVREHGRSLGRISEDAETQRRKSAEFVQNHDCLRDDICVKYCLHCTRSFNVQANQERL